MKSLRTVAAALSFGSTAYAAISQQCVSSDVCYSLSIPESTANSGSGDIFFQLTAPSEGYEWVALGQGNGMSGSNIFVMYTSSDGNNVTVSPRLGTGHVEPQHDTAARITVLEGSGIENGKMTANVQCSNCASWSGGSMDFSSSSASWIYAVKSGSALNSDSLSESISQHDDASAFTWQMSDAQGGNDANPFVAAGGSTGTATGGATAAPTATTSYTVSGTVIPGTCTPIVASGTATTSGSAATITNDGSDDACPTGRPTTRPPASCFRSGYPHPTGGPPKVKRDDGCPAGYQSTSNSISPDNLVSSSSTSSSLILAHGVIACIAFVALFPIGGILIRVASFSGLLWIHAALQGFGVLFYIVAFGMGVYLATTLDYMSRAHPIIGIALLVVVLLQPVLGFMHHKLFKKYNHRTFWSYAHIWHGRVAVLLGIVNGGLGIQLAGDTSSGQKIAYAVIAAIVGVAYIGAAIFGEIKRRRKQPPTYEKSQRRQSHQLRDLSSSEEHVRQHQGYYGNKDSQRI